MSEIGERILSRLEEVHPRTSQRALAERVSMDPSALSRAVNGKRGLAGDEIVALAAELSVSADWLLTGEELFPVQVAARHEYSRATGYQHEGGTHFDDIVRGFTVAYRQATGLETRDRLVVPSMPVKVRTLLHESFGDGWTRHLADAIEKTFGIHIVKADLGDAHGCTLNLPNATVIISPTGVFWGRQNWALAHELGHIAAGDFTAIDEQVSDRGENQANTFAADLLLPEKSIRAIDWVNISDSELAQFLWATGVSLEALNNRLRYLGLPVLSRRSVLAFLQNNLTPIQVGDIAQRVNDAATRRIPEALIRAHEAALSSRRTLAWLLDAPIDDDAGEDEPPADLEGAADLLGLTLAR